MLFGSAACYWLSLSSPVGSTQASPPLSFCLRSSQLPGALDMCKQPLPKLCQVQEWQKGAKCRQIKKHVTLQISQIIVWHEAVVWLEGFGPLHRSWKYICYSGANGRQLERFYMIWWIVWGRATQPFTVCKMGLFPHSALQNGIKKDFIVTQIGVLKLGSHEQVVPPSEISLRDHGVSFNVII